MSEITKKTILDALDNAIHYAHAWDKPDTRSAYLMYWSMHRIFDPIHENKPFDLHTYIGSLQQLVELQRKPSIQWGIGDACWVALQKSGHVQTTKPMLVLPTNTSLSTKARSVEHAKTLLGMSPFIDLKQHKSATLGTILQTRLKDLIIAHTVCRKPGNPSILNLQLPESTDPLMEMIVPFWGTLAEVPIWVQALTPDMLPGLDKTHYTWPRRVEFWFTPEQTELGREFERAMIRAGILIGRIEHACVPYTDGDLGSNSWPELARRVKPDGPLTPDIYALWKYSGVELSGQACATICRILDRESGVAGR